MASASPSLALRRGAIALFAAAAFSSFFTGSAAAAAEVPLSTQNAPAVATAVHSGATERTDASSAPRTRAEQLASGPEPVIPIWARPIIGVGLIIAGLVAARARKNGSDDSDDSEG